MITILFSVLLVVLYRTGQMAQHGKLTGRGDDFFGSSSSNRKYKVKKGMFIDAPDTWYYRFNDLEYKERWPTSTTLTVFLTDWYHLSQFLWLRCLNIIIADTMTGNFWLWFFGSWVGVSGLMWATEKVFKRK